MRVVCFDLGGVLVEINPRWRGALLDAGLPDALARRFDVPLTDFEPFNDFQRGLIALGDYLGKLSKLFGGIGEGRARDAHNAILRTVYPGIPELITDIHEAGLASGCLSNTNAPHWEAVHESPRLAVLKKVRYRVASHLIGAEKPDPAIYRAFEAASGASHEGICYFDDGGANVDAARELGWIAHVVDPSADPAGQVRRQLAELGWLGR